MNTIETHRENLKAQLGTETNYANAIRNFSTRQAAGMLGVSIRTMEGWRMRGQGPSYVKLSRSRRARVRYSEKALADFVERMTVQGAEGIGQC